MNFAINYSPPAGSLLRQGAIRVDCFKTPPWPDMIAEASQLAPVAVHFPLETGTGMIAETDWEALDSFRKSTGTPYVNIHLVAYSKDFPGVAKVTPPGPDYDRISRQLIEEVRLVTERFGPENVIVENVPYKADLGRTLRPAAEPEMMMRLVEETGCGFLLDISHARIAAHYLGVDAHAYMECLPVDRIRELHFAGVHDTPEGLVDHLDVHDSDWVELAWVLERIQCGAWAEPWLLAFEYGGIGEVFAWRTNPQVIAEQTPRIYEMVKNGK